MRDKLLAYLRKRLEGDPLPLRLVFRDGHHFDFAAAPTVTLVLHSNEPVRALLKGDFQRLGDAYVNGAISVEGNIDDVLAIGISLAERFGRLPMFQRVAKLARFIPRSRSADLDAANVQHHYDVGNDFYRLWLDERMIYSCAYFKTGVEDIHTAQRQKLDHLCRKLMLRPGERLLDVGCGWGSLLIWAATHYGIRGVGITLSERQYSYAKELVAASAVADRIEIRLQHYRELRNDAPYDKIVSVGMYEHVGLENLSSYFSTIADTLSAGGAFLNHGIVATDPEGRPRGPAGGEFIDRYVFPGGAVPHLARVLVELSRVGLEFADAEDLRPHYARTLQHWSRRLEAHQNEAIQAAGEKRFRIWRVFLAGMARAFDRGWLSIEQVLSFKPLESGEVRRPWTRAYQYAEYPFDLDTMPRSGRLEWNH
ncbi:MAG: class I SAM-dependent methyltransferase [Bradyrhizobium sp.]|uniref:class I SAM-dependent methyltransferase n=1 Tax=Bradyrhizobium sp. TaxID=376 RepID=UPI001C296B9D|nr:class I SAM-dependent methyltransferase [Bradyrhizobium sp.]MBU6462567.1 cyclopropane-fatty-acyl-phospholipid synthase family protein [Pseudomonadota bacterium]MDE2067188.1 class I SAM-dependent methyltransferase [Bradyrhizobium sp.]MDE2468353.1 class I SAM-dependent methyltransferase [Bradyrhizobium sp.]